MHAIHNMIEYIEIKGFKVFEKDKIILKPLTILTGENSSGKSSLIQALLFLGNPVGFVGTPYNQDLHNYLRSLGHNELFNKNGAKEIILKTDSLSFKWTKQEQSSEYEVGNFQHPNQLSYPENLIYLNADKHRITQINQYVEDLHGRYFGIYGDFVANYYEHHKRNPIENYLIKDQKSTSLTLEGQVNFWFQYMTGMEDLTIESSKVTPSLVKSFYKIDDQEFLPENLGTGLSHIFAILVIGLSAQKGNIVIFENPEVHLHPKVQSKLGEFFAFLASRGIQMIIETHNDHLINRVRYEVYSQSIKSEDVIIHYKTIDQPFEQIKIGENGKFINKYGENSFPEGFYDATLQEIYQINRGK